MATTFPALLFLVVLACTGAASGFYLPGVVPADFRKNDLLAVKVNQLSSIRTQLPYSYYSLPFCRPDTIINSAENLGQVLRGDRIENSPYVFEMMEPKLCQIVCKIVLTEQGANDIKEKIEDEYRVNMILDNLPMVVPITMFDRDAPPFYQHGVHVGVKGLYAGSKDVMYFIHNHYSFLVKYNKEAQTDLARIVAFEVKPYSCKHKPDGDWKGNATRLKTCNPHSGRLVVNSDGPQQIEANKEIIFTYDVNFEESDIKWASRWDTYLRTTDGHWFPIVNSLTTVLFLSVMVAMIMLRTLYRDISKYNQLESQEEAQEESGWKLLHGDVFRPPVNADLLCVYVGTGVQFFGTLLVTLLTAILGLLSPSNRGGFMTAMLLLWVFMGLFAGYSTARLYKMFGGMEWKKVAIRTVLVFPGVVFLIFFALNMLLWGVKSSSAVPFTTMFALVFLWLGISMPLIFIGSYLGFKKPAIEDPVRTNKIPRPIPQQPWYMNPAVSMLIGAV
ncbi:transmembrane 9 superfamily member 8-like isoform X2 [Miscanthus floridulus]|uniref:transmembrane 9 superfamily member 8-like isoform X2 n=1 Tax=Miscanthus floridulus TaxID=154761 RepID=UPI003457656E